MTALALAPPYRPTDGAGFGVLCEQRLIHADLRQWREQHGFTQHRLGQAIGVSGTVISHIETLRVYPSEEVRQRLAALTGIDADRLFPPWLAEWIGGEPVERTTYHEVSFEDLGPRDRWETTYTLEDSDPALAWQGVREGVQRVLETLTPRERRVIEYRFGVNDAPRLTLAAIGQQFGISRERVRQIEARAFRKLRHPSRSRQMRLLLWDEQARWVASSAPSPKRPANIIPWLAWLAKHPKQQGDRPSRLANIVFEYACCTVSRTDSALRAHVRAQHMPETARNREFWEAWDEMIAALPPSVHAGVA